MFYLNYFSYDFMFVLLVFLLRTVYLKKYTTKLRITLSGIGLRHLFANLISTKINKTKYNLNGKQGHLPICFLNSAYREMNFNDSNCQNEKKIKRSDENLNKL